VDAPAIGTHHLEVLLLLLRAEGIEGLVPFTRVEPAARPATADAAPMQLFAHASSCDNPSQQLAGALLLQDRGP
jgi:hypothetical protein